MRRPPSVALARGALHDLLRNRLYVGEVRHRDLWYPGEHIRIIPSDLWQKVQNQLDNNLKARRRLLRDRASSLLTGLIEDTTGNRLTPAFTVKNGRRYRYYVSQAVVQNPGKEQTNGDFAAIIFRVFGPTKQGSESG
jgi:site-specific DNA recombinase